MNRGKYILILEDEALVRKALRILVEQSTENCIVLEADNIIDAYHLTEENPIDLFLLDIILGPSREKEGIYFAEMIRTIEQYEVTPIVFITSVAYYEKMAFHNIHCYDYLLKPIEEEMALEIFKRLLKTRKKIEIDEKYVEFMEHGVIFPVQVKEIDFIEYAQRRLHVYTKGEKYEFKNMSLSECIQRVRGTSIIQIHKSILVNAKKILNYDQANRVLTIQTKIGKKMLDVGKKYKENIREFIRDDMDNTICDM